MSSIVGGMDTRHTIGELARAAEVPSSTVRHYERTGLLRPAGRTPANYRIYGAEELERLRFIRAAQSAGFTLKDVKTLLEFHDGTTSPCEEVRLLIEERLSHVREQMHRLRQVQRVLSSFRDHCRQAAADDGCPVVEELRETAKGPEDSPAR